MRSGARVGTGRDQRKWVHMKQEKWYVAAKRADFEELGKKFSIDPVVARLIRNRDIVGEEAVDK